MNKKLIAAAVAAVFVAPMAASAESTIYGNIHSSIQQTDKENRFGDVQDNWDAVSNDGQLGIQGSEDLGGGLKALYKFEIDFDTVGDTETQDSQLLDGTVDEVWIGLTGGFGTFLIGREDTPYKTFMDSAKVDVLGDSIIDVDSLANRAGGSKWQRFTANGAIAYISPTFSGFTGGAAIVPGGESGVGSNNEEDSIADHFSLGANYVAGGLRVAAGYQELVEPATGDPTADVELDTWGLGASYTFGSFMVGAKYEDEELDDGASNDLETERFALSGKYTLGNNELMAVYVLEESERGSTDITDIDGYGLAAKHNFSNRTSVYAAYSSAENDEQLEEESDQFAVGLIHSF